MGTAFAALYWYGMGTLMTSESPELSHRVRRRLPKSTFARVMLTWFNPGPSTGYAFAIVNFTAVLLIFSCAAISEQWIRDGGIYSWPNGFVVRRLFSITIPIWCYFVLFLGTGKLLVGGLRRLTPVSMTASVLIHVLTSALIVAVPYSIQMSFRAWRNAGYTWLQLPNPFWTINEISMSMPDDEAIATIALLVLAAFTMLLVQLMPIVREARQERVALPRRLAEEEALREKLAHGPQSPWDDGVAMPQG